MRKIIGSIEGARQQIEGLRGKEVTVRYRKGRNRAEVFHGRVEQIYSNVFILTLQNELFDRISCSYTDVICGDVSIREHRPSK